MGVTHQPHLIGDEDTLRAMIRVEEAFGQCPKALIRSDLWNSDTHISRDERLPSGGEILGSLRAGFDAAGYDRARAARYARREGFY